MATPMLGPDEAPPFEWLNPHGAAPCLIVCDHAAHRIPASLAHLGVAPVHRQEHIAWDIGAAAMARRLSALLDAPALLAGYSRLVVDCNRYLDAPAAFPAVSDAIEIPGNATLSEAQRAQRAEGIYHPYHAAIETALMRFERAAIAPVLLAVHTMTERMRDAPPRAQEFTLCWARDDRLVAPVLDGMRAQGVITGDNEPYRLDLGEDYTVPEHAMRRGLAHLQIEVRQDLVREEHDALRWADMIHAAIAGAITDRQLRAPQHYWP